jgi:hypothetical protein
MRTSNPTILIIFVFVSASCCVDVSFIHSFQTLMQLKIVHNLTYFKMPLKSHSSMLCPLRL